MYELSNESWFRSSFALGPKSVSINFYRLFAFRFSVGLICLIECHVWDFWAHVAVNYWVANITVMINTKVVYVWWKVFYGILYPFQCITRLKVMHCANFVQLFCVDKNLRWNSHITPTAVILRCAVCASWYLVIMILWSIMVVWRIPSWRIEYGKKMFLLLASPFSCAFSLSLSFDFRPMSNAHAMFARLRLSKTPMIFMFLIYIHEFSDEFRTTCETHNLYCICAKIVG